MEHIANVVWTGPWWKNRGIRRLNMFISLALFTSVINGYDSSVINGMQILGDWQDHFDHPKGVKLGLMTGAQNFGALLSLPFAPYCSDGIGRRKTHAIGSFIILGGVALQAMASTVVHFIISRLLIGIGIGFASNAAPLLVTELAYPTQRGPLTAMYNSSWYLGSILSGWITYLTLKTMSGSDWAWRVPALIQAGPSLFQAIFVWFIPESPRYLIAKGQDAEALEILTKYHADGRDRDPLVHFTYGQIREALAIEREIAQTTSIMTLFRTPGNRRRLRIILAIGFFSQWSGNGLVSYYIKDVLTTIGITDDSTQSIINVCIQMWSFGVAMTAALLVDKIGRRPLFITSNGGMLAVFASMTAVAAVWDKSYTEDPLNPNRNAANATIALLCLFMAMYSLAYTPMLVAYTIEILPYGVRARGFALMNFTICIGIVTNQFVNPIALDALRWKYYLVYVGWLVVELAWIWAFVVETKGKTLEETAAVFDGQRHLDNLATVGHDAATTSQHVYRAQEKTEELEMSIPTRRQSDVPTLASEDGFQREFAGPGGYGDKKGSYPPSPQNVYRSPTSPKSYAERW